MQWAMGGKGERGLNVTTVYGDNVAFSIGANYTAALGPFGQLVIDPLAIAELAPWKWLKGFTAGALGGNAQFTLGTNTAFILGANFAVQLTRDEDLTKPEKERQGQNALDAKIKTEECLLIDLLCVVLAVVTAAWATAYGLVEGDIYDWDRIGIVSTSQVLAGAIQSVIMTVAMYHEEEKKEEDQIRGKIKDAYSRMVKHFKK